MKKKGVNVFIKIFILLFFAIILLSNVVDSLNLEMTKIPKGNFTMGDVTNDLDSSHRPLRGVNLSEFYISKYELTNEQVVEILKYANQKGYIDIYSRNITLKNNLIPLIGLGFYGSEIKFENQNFIIRPGREKHPAGWISWYGGLALSNWLSEMQGLEPVYDLTTWTWDKNKRGYRLPTEAEWEYAARGGREGLRFPWGSTTSHEYANYKSLATLYYDLSTTRGYHPLYISDVIYSSPVGSFEQNDYGLYDTSGNVWEWTWDWFSTYNSNDVINPMGPLSGITKVFRGGSWTTSAERTIVAMRYGGSRPDDTIYDVGIRFAINSYIYHPADSNTDKIISADELGPYIDNYLNNENVKIFEALYALSIVQKGGTYSYIGIGSEDCINYPGLCWV